jgi:Outer membrane protein beta-barrel domain
MMRRVSGILGVVAALMIFAAPRTASAEGFVSPWIGVNFGSDPFPGLVHGDVIDGGRTSFGVTAGYMGGGIIGGEVDFGYSPSFFGDESDFGSNNLLTAMGNIIVGIPIGGTHGAGVRPYVTGGIGLIRTSYGEILNFDAISNNDFGYNLGAGIMGYFNSHFGLRGDVRYFRNLEDHSSVVNGVNVDLGGLHFWRASLGVVIK